MEYLKNNINYRVVGFYSVLGLGQEDTGLLQTVYLIDGKYYVAFQNEDVCSKIIFRLDAISDLYKSDREKCNFEVSEFMSHFSDKLTCKGSYKLFEVDIGDIHDLIPFDESKTIVSESLRVNGNYYNGAIGLGDGRIALGDEAFLEKVVLENVTDKRKKYELLEEIYNNYYNFEKRDKVISDFCHEFYDTLNEFDREMWDHKRLNNSLILYAFGLLGPLVSDLQELEVKTIEDMKVLRCPEQ